MLAGILGVIGIGLLSSYFNLLSGILGALALLSYAFIYTPMKQLSPVSVFIGAIPGAMPLIIGSVAATNAVTTNGIILFAIQFLWQLPHFWSIAWLLDSDYKKAGFRLLPTPDGEKSRSAAVQCLPYLLVLVVVSTLPYLLGYAGVVSLLIGLAASLFYLLRGFDFVIHLDDASAKKLMFTSFGYIPVVLLSYVLDKI
jgi:protoheme IX farnesyltransferase